MAFNPERLSLLVQPIGEGGLRFFGYQTDDVEATVTAAGYATNAADYGLRAYDLVFISPANGTEEPYILAVDSIDADGHATLASPGPIGDLKSANNLSDVADAATALANLGGMAKATYDPTNVAGDAFDMDNMAEGANTKIMTAVERELVGRVISPFQFGGVGDGVTNDGPAINLLFDYVRSLLSTDASITGPTGDRQAFPFDIDFSGGVWATDISLNATGILAWNLNIRSGMFIGRCTGKAVLDAVGSRGLNWRDILIYGDPNNKPSVGLQAARTVAVAACDFCSYDNVNTTGYFTTAGVVTYGQEVTRWSRCDIFNYEYTGYAAVFQGFDVVAMSSDYQTIISGLTSCTVVNFDNCSFYYLPVNTSDRAVATGITNASNGVVTCSAGHPFVDGDLVVWQTAGGMPLLAGYVITVSGVSGNTFETGVDTTSMGAFGDGGTFLRAQDRPTLLVAGVSLWDFDTCYVVAYGKPHVQFDFPQDPGAKSFENCRFHGLFEGIGSSSNVSITPRSGGFAQFQSLELHVMNSNAFVGAISVDDTGGAQCTFSGLKVTFDGLFYWDVPLIVPASNAATFIRNGDITYNKLSNVQWESYGGFNGRIYDITTGEIYQNNVTTFGLLDVVDSGGDTLTLNAPVEEYVLVATATTGTIGSGATLLGRWEKLALKTRRVSMRATIPDIGTMATALRLTLPVASSASGNAPAVWHGINASDLKPLIGYISPGDAYVTIRYAESPYAFPVASGETIWISGVYETA